MNTELISRLNYHLENGMLPERVEVSIRMAIAELKKHEQEPVAWMIVKENGTWDIEFKYPNEIGWSVGKTPIYLSPTDGKDAVTQKPLSDDDLERVLLSNDKAVGSYEISIARDIEKAHGIGV